MLHMDEARRAAIDALKDKLASTSDATRVVLIDDLFGMLRLVLWAPDSESEKALVQELDQALKQKAERYWSGEIWLATTANDVDRLVYDQAWLEGRELIKNKIRTLNRHRTRGAWFTPITPPPWPIDETSSNPPIVVFYSFKGGMGRSTALAAFAIRRARAGERVVVIDGDLGAPGIGKLLAADANGTISPWGVVDYLLESALGHVGLDDYYHACRREKITGQGEILVVPAGNVNDEYLDKLARVDLEPHPRAMDKNPFSLLIDSIRTSLTPDWILIDSRTGLSEPAGIFLGGLAHLHVLLGTSSEQSWEGLRVVLKRLGADRVRSGQPQVDCLLVHAMVPRSSAEISGHARARFTDRARDEFMGNYYAQEPSNEKPDDRLWYVGDAENRDAPHVPTLIHYDEGLAFFRDIEDVADLLIQTPDYTQFSERIEAYVGRIR